jgi:hypothetical protein
MAEHAASFHGGELVLNFFHEEDSCCRSAVDGVRQSSLRFSESPS